jgi:hypothetical protein
MKIYDKATVCTRAGGGIPLWCPPDYKEEFLIHGNTPTKTSHYRR